MRYCGTLTRPSSSDWTDSTGTGLREVVRVCERSPTLAHASKELFAQSRRRNTTSNDSDRIRKYRARFELSWSDIRH
jgi:transcriptional regulatory protein RtcR